MDKTILIRSLIKNKANNQFSITLPKKDVIGLGKSNEVKEPKKIKIKIKGLLW